MYASSSADKPTVTLPMLDADDVVIYSICISSPLLVLARPSAHPLVHPCPIPPQPSRSSQPRLRPYNLYSVHVVHFSP